MKAASQKPQRDSLPPQAFEELLRALGPDRGSAALRYESLRQRLVKFFTWERCSFPEDRADEVINRFARRLAEGETVTNAENYCHGIARLVVLESRLEMSRMRETSGELQRLAGPSARTESETEICLGKCLEALEASQREFLLAYYEGEKSQRIENRLRLAEKLGISLNSLRNRALRLREKVENCTRRCGGGKGARDTAGAPHTED